MGRSAAGSGSGALVAAVFSNCSSVMKPMVSTPSSICGVRAGRGAEATGAAAGFSAGLAFASCSRKSAGKSVYTPHSVQRHFALANPSGISNRWPQPRQWIGTSMNSVRNALGDAHEHVFQIDLLFLQHFQTQIGLHQQLGDETAVFHTVFQGDFQDVFRLFALHRLHVGMAFEMIASG